MSAAFTHNPYTRGIRDYLWDNYGIDPEFFRGANHDRIRFTYNGSQETMTLQRSGVKSGENQSTLRMKLQDIRRLLGDPPPRQRKPKEPPMTFNPLPISNPRSPEPAPSPQTRHGVGRLALMGGNRCLKFSFPNWVREELGPQVKITSHGHDSWQLEPAEVGSKILKGSASTEVINLSGHSLLNSGVVPFPAHETELLLTEGTLLVRLLNPTLMVPSPAAAPTQPSVHQIVTPPAPPKEIQMPAPPPAASPPHHEQAADVTTNLTRLLKDIREVERHTPYRLKHLRDGAGPSYWAWVVPPIKLED